MVSNFHFLTLPVEIRFFFFTLEAVFEIPILKYLPELMSGTDEWKKSCNFFLKVSVQRNLNCSSNIQMKN